MFRGPASVEALCPGMLSSSGLGAAGGQPGCWGRRGPGRAAHLARGPGSGPESPGLPERNEPESGQGAHCGGVGKPAGWGAASPTPRAGPGPGPALRTLLGAPWVSPGASGHAPHLRRRAGPPADSRGSRGRPGGHPEPPQGPRQWCHQRFYLFFKLVANI